MDHTLFNNFFLFPEVTPPHGDTTEEDHGSDVHWEDGPHYLTIFLFPEVTPPHGDTTEEDPGSDVHWEDGPHYFTIFCFQRCLRYLMGTLQ